ncbi:MAG: hypothetical protein KatS3mg102_2815 [Planctomycetota bacterium]|nr:MAG: hypothetical protein KatS3mg102_2815 [Planctomycetota bacterium]
MERGAGAARRPQRWLVAGWLGLLAAGGAGGCYYAQLAAGQLRVLCGRVPLAEAARDPRLSEEERRLLRLAPAVLAFADTVMGMERAGAYETFYDTGAEAVSYNVSACAKTSFRRVFWRYPLIGAMPYKGYFDRAAAEAEAARLRAQGLDARVSGVAAYSTLGWFRDPIFRSMLRGGEVSFVVTLLHEIAHATVFRDGDAAFNESLATFAGEQGALDFYAARDGVGSAAWRRAWEEIHDQRVVAAAMRALYQRLWRLYASPVSEADKLAGRERIFEAARGLFGRLVRERLRTGRWDWLGRLALDNCVVLAFQTYHGRQRLFAEVYRQVGRDWRRFFAVVREAARAPAPFRWLDRWSRGREQLRARAGRGEGRSLPPG